MDSDVAAAIVPVKLGGDTSSDTICALSSAPGRAGVAVVRVSGPRAGEVLRTLAGPLPEPRRAALRTLREPGTGEEIDRAIILMFAAPASFTGEDVAEIHAHGGRAVVASILRALTALGCRLAEPGEFARRAFESGRIDLTQAEGLADLIEAETEAQRRQAARQAGGGLARLYEDWRSQLLAALALVEAAIDFSDEADVAADAVAQARAATRRLAARLAAHLADGRRGEIVREGFRVVLAGPPNVGKSSLLNALARRDVAIVSAEAGTTRDVLEVRLDLDGLPVIVADTAGIRPPAGEVEREGIRRTIARGREADLVVWLMDATAPQWRLPDELGGAEGRALLVMNKVDLVGSISHAGSTPHDGAAPGADMGSASAIPVSAVTGEGIAALVGTLAAYARERIAPDESPAITQARHRAAVEACARDLRRFLDGDGEALELRAEDLRAAAAALGRLTGRIEAEQVLDQIFSRFCIGK